ncbi:MAG TPA: serpin family protein [Longimicrobiales bacterium]|nr:serpin family protein [Longimicrobiales bacterium]
MPSRPTHRTARLLRARGLAAAALLLSACGDATGPEPITELPRALTASEQAVIRHANGFGFELMREVLARDDRDNVVLSPFSASMALGMTLNGAAGGTFDAMSATLGFEGLTQSEINDSYAGLIVLLTGLDPEVRFDIANAIFANEDFPFHDAFMQAVAAAFDAHTETRDFSDPATLDAVNAWVDASTGGLIDRILEELDPDLVMLLLNAIYFDGAWTTQFDPADTRRQSFTRADGSQVDVDMMNIDEVELPLGHGATYSAVELPYGGEAFSMVVAVPHGGVDLRDFFASLDEAAWDALVEGLNTTEVDLVAIPKFTLTYDTFLNDALMAMGMDVAFRPGADFTNLSPLGDRLCIDFVRQKTFIEVDERGTRAAAVTAVGIRPTSFNGLIADRPFAFAIRERLSGTILFMGAVGDPTAEDPGAEPYTRTCL